MVQFDPQVHKNLRIKIIYFLVLDDQIESFKILEPN